MRTTVLRACWLLAILAAPLAAQSDSVHVAVQRATLDTIASKVTPVIAPWCALKSTTAKRKAACALNARLLAKLAAAESSPVPPPVVTPPPVVVPPTFPGVAELPRFVPTMPAATPMRPVHVTGNLQAAINAAVGGDVLLVAPDALASGNFVLPNRPDTGWVIIRTDTTLSTMGRMTPALAASHHLARIQTPNALPAISTAPGAHHWRLTALEITHAPGVTGFNMLVKLDGRPHDLILDLDYIHADSVAELRRCVLVNSARTILAGNWISDCHNHSADAQGVIGWSGTAGLLLVNNHIEASHEVVAFGGSDPSDSTLTPQDITLRGNHITRPQSYKGVWQVKVLLETKNVKRLDVDGNVFENSWEDAQSFAVNLKSENQDDTAPFSQTADVTLRRNRFTCLAGWLSLSGKGSSPHVNVRAARFTITDNLVEQMNVAPCTGSGNVIQLLSGIEDVTIAHNTILNTGPTNTLLTLGDPLSATRFQFQSNVASIGTYGIKLGGTASGTASITSGLPGALFGANLLLGAPCAKYPATTVCGALPASLPQGHDGAPVGARLDVRAYTAGVP